MINWLKVGLCHKATLRGPKTSQMLLTSSATTMCSPRSHRAVVKQRESTLPRKARLGFAWLLEAFQPTNCAIFWFLRLVTFRLLMDFILTRYLETGVVLFLGILDSYFRIAECFFSKIFRLNNILNVENIWTARIFNTGLWSRYKIVRKMYEYALHAASKYRIKTVIVSVESSYLRSTIWYIMYSCSKIRNETHTIKHAFEINLIYFHQLILY